MRKISMVWTILLAACSGGTADPVAADAAVTPADALADVAPADGTDAYDTVGGALVKDLAAFCDPWATWACQRAATCGCGHPKGGPLTSTDCLAKTKAVCAADLDNVAQAMAVGGGIGVDPGEVPKCIAWLDATLPQCIVGAKWALTNRPCRKVFLWTANSAETCMGGELPCADGTGCVQGKCGAAGLADGSACQDHGQCASYVCSKASGTCISPQLAGASCLADDACAPLDRCLNGVCAARGAAGATCALDEDCAMMLSCLQGKCAVPAGPCAVGAACGNGGKCLGPIHNICAPRKAKDAPCSQDGECTTGLACAAQKCQPLPAMGMPCAVSCASGLACAEATQVCEALPTDGQPCAMGEKGPFLCGGGLACQADTFVCKPPPGKGEVCANPSVCSQADVTGDGKGGDLACAFGPTGSFCVLKRGVGEACENEACQDGLHCSYATGKCAPILANGSKCKDGNECGPSGSCVPDELGALRCVPLPEKGAACLFDCAEGLWCDKGMTAPSCLPPICQMFYQLQ